MSEVGEREDKLEKLREVLERSIAEGGDVTDAELDAALDQTPKSSSKRGS